MEEPGGIPATLGPFEIDREVGRGGSAVVYAARREGGRGFQAKLALKVEREVGSAASRERFIEEADRLARIAHPSIVRVHEAGELPDGRAYLAMDLLEGETLATCIARGPMPLEEAKRVFASIASAVSSLHEAGLVHRDIKAENVMLVGDPPSPVLLDLGIAKEANAEPSTTTREGVVRGTPATMAPERFFGQSATVASDVYELGVLLYAMLLGRLPWDDGSDVDQRLAAKPPRDLDPEIPLAISDAIMEALVSRPARRPVSVKALADRVLKSAPRAQAERSTAALDARPSAPNDTPAGTSLSGQQPSTLRRGRWVLPALALGLVTAASATVFGLRRDGAHAADPPSPASPTTTIDASTVASSTTPSQPASDADAMATATSTSEAGPEATPSPPTSASAEEVATESRVASPSPSGSSKASVAPAPLPSVAGFPACNEYLVKVCDDIAKDPAPVHFVPWLCVKGELAKEIAKAGETGREKLEAKCQQGTAAHIKRVEDKEKAEESIEGGELPACKAWLEKSCSPEVKRRKATQDFCSWNTIVARNLAIKNPKDANRLCQGSLDNWDNAVDEAIAKKAREDGH